MKMNSNLDAVKKMDDKIIFYPSKKLKNRAELIFESKDCGEVVIESNSLINIIMDYLSENHLEEFTAKDIRYKLALDGRFRHIYYLDSLPSQIGRSLRYLARVHPSKIKAFKKEYGNFTDTTYTYQVLEPFRKRIEHTIIYS